jgi:hypothetical protein
MLEVVQRTYEDSVPVTAAAVVTQKRRSIFIPAVCLFGRLVVCVKYVILCLQNILLMPTLDPSRAVVPITTGKKRRLSNLLSFTQRVPAGSSPRHQKTYARQYVKTHLESEEM